MPKSTKTTSKNRTQVKDLPVPTKEITKKEKQKVRGGVLGIRLIGRKRVVSF